MPPPLGPLLRRAGLLLLPLGGLVLGPVALLGLLGALLVLGGRLLLDLLGLWGDNGSYG